MRRRVVTVSLPTPAPEAAYPEYDQVRAEAERQGRGPLDPRKLPEMEAVAVRRGRDWCASVLGRTYGGISFISTVEAFMLLVADDMGLEPPLPQLGVEARRAFEAGRLEDRLRRERQQEQERQRWEAALSTCPVKVTVRSNLNRPRRSVLHAVTDIPVRSSRGVHPAGRALCERTRSPRRLSEPIDGGVGTCQSCVRYVAEIRPMGADSPSGTDR